MVQIKVIKSEFLNEFVILELQGELLSRFNEGLAGNIIGDLHFKNDGTPILIIGHHILYGQVKKLEKPFAVMQKKKNQTNDFGSSKALNL